MTHNTEQLTDTEIGAIKQRQARRRATNAELIEAHSKSLQLTDTEGEWRVLETITRSSVVDERGNTVAVGCGRGAKQRRENAAQIVVDHKAAKSQALLVEALREITARAQFALTTPGFIRGRDELQKAVDAALKAAGV